MARYFSYVIYAQTPDSYVDPVLTHQASVVEERVYVQEFLATGQGNQDSNDGDDKPRILLNKVWSSCQMATRSSSTSPHVRHHDDDIYIDLGRLYLPIRRNK